MYCRIKSGKGKKQLMLRSWQPALENTNTASTFIPTRVAVPGRGSLQNCKMVKRNTRWPLLHLPTGEGWNLQFPIRTNTISNLPHHNSFFVLLQRHFLQVLNRTEQKSHLIHWTFRNAWKPVSTANEIKTVELWQIENLLKTVQQSMQPVSILVFKKKSISKEILVRALFERCSFLELFTANC